MNRNHAYQTVISAILTEAYKQEAVGNSEMAKFLRAMAADLQQRWNPEV